MCEWEHGDKKLKVKSTDLRVGSKVLLQQKRLNKTTPAFETEPYVITSKAGTMITAKNNNRTVTRNVSFFKRFIVQGDDDREERVEETSSESEDDFRTLELDSESEKTLSENELQNKAAIKVDPPDGDDEDENPNDVLKSRLRKNPRVDYKLTRSYNKKV